MVQVQFWGGNFQFYFFNKKGLSLPVEKFSKCIKNGNDRLRNGNLLRLHCSFARKSRFHEEDKVNLRVSYSNAIL